MINRGAVHIIDAFLASLVISVALLYTCQAPLGDIQPEPLGFSAIGFQALLCLDKNSSLGKLIVDENWGEMEQQLNLVLPTGMSYNLTIIDENDVIVNDRLVSNGGLREQNIESVEYLLAVERGECPLYKIRLQIGR